MHNNIEGLTPQHQQLLLEAAQKLSADFGFDSILEEFKKMYFNSQGHDAYDHAPARLDAQYAFRHLHDFLAVAEMVFGQKEYCHQLAV